MSWAFYWLTEIQSDRLLYGRENKESVCLVSFNIKFWLDCLTLKNASRNGELRLKTEIVLIWIHLTGS